MRTITAAVPATLMSLVLGALALAQPPAAPPAQAAAPEPRWTPSAEAPAGVLAHALEGQRHDFFIELAQQGNIELVFFGTTEAEMWWWPDRGRGVWDREFGSLAAANFGSQGTHLESLVWRMQNGELDGFEARLIVQHAGLVDDETVFYTDIGDRFFNGAGSFRNETWALDLANRGTQSSAYEFWAEAMQPWIDRYVR